MTSAEEFYTEKLENFKRRFASDLLKAGIPEKDLRELVLSDIQRALVFLKSSGHLALLQGARDRGDLSEVLPLICLFGGMSLERLQRVWEGLPEHHTDPERSSRSLLWAYWDLFSKGLKVANE